MKILLKLLCLVLVVTITTAATKSDSSRSKKKDRREQRSSSNRKNKNQKNESSVDSRYQSERPDEKMTAQSFTSKRTKPVFSGEFEVRLVIVNFKDTTEANPEETIKAVSSFSPTYSASDYFKEYSQGVCWPKIVYAGSYTAPNICGYYSSAIRWSNMTTLGVQDIGERVAKLKSDALKSLKIKNEPNSTICFVFNGKLAERSIIEPLLRKYYPIQKRNNQEIDTLMHYNPQQSVRWGDPMWPNSTPQVWVNSGASTFVHELGHVMGAPDYYRAPPLQDGISGSPTPSLFGPPGPGPAYCRAIYQAFLPMESYPTLTETKEVTLAPRSTNPFATHPLGIFVPSQHPSYLFYIEYKNGNLPFMESPSEKGLLVHVINVKLGSEFTGPPDTCYLYRPNDPCFLGHGDIKNALLKEGGVFENYTLPNQLPINIKISDIKLSDNATFTLTVLPHKLSNAEIKAANLPKISLDKLDEIQATSFRVHSSLLYRGEPHKTEYGFCYDTFPKPTIKKKTYPLFHRDRYDARIIGLRPGAKYYVRAYVKNSDGVTYSDEMSVQTLQLKDVTNVPPLLTDRLNNASMPGIFSNPESQPMENGFLLRTSAFKTYLKLLNYYRMPLNGAKPDKDDAFITKIHTSPNQFTTPQFRIAANSKAYNEAMNSFLRAGGMLNAEFDKNWDKNFAKAFKLKLSKTVKDSPIVDVTEDNIETQTARMKAFLIAGNPVICVRESLPLSPIACTLDWVLIDGFNENGIFHVVFPDNDTDRYSLQTKRKSGYLPLTELFDTCNAVKIIYLSPLKK